MPELERTQENLDSPSRAEMSAQEVQELLQLASRLRASSGGELDDSAILAVAEASGASPEYVRLALQHTSAPPTQRATPLTRVRQTFLSLDPSVRRFVASGYLACGLGLVSALVGIYGDQSSMGGILILLLVLAAIGNAAVSRETRTAVLAGAVFGALSFISRSLFLLLASALVPIPRGWPPILMIAFVALGGVVGYASQRALALNRHKLGLKDPVQERQDLLQQMVELQERLRSTEQSLSILSVDIVGSVRLKDGRDQLDVEYTFGEYHRFVEQVSKRFRGRLHSTAGDGVTMAFDRPADAFAAARAIQAGLFEFNGSRNRLGEPIALRVGIHHGTVMAAGNEIANVNFAKVIDVAAHLQKQCPVGAVAISETAVLLIPQGPQVIGDETLMLGDLPARVWRPSHSLVQASAFGAPPPPFTA